MRLFAGTLIVFVEADPKLRFISDDPDSLFYRVPRRILCCIDGCPSKICPIFISFDEESERLIFCATNVEADKERFTISVQIDRIFKLMEVEGLTVNADLFDRLFAIAHQSRQLLMIRAISAYIKKNVQI